MNYYAQLGKKVHNKNIAAEAYLRMCRNRDRYVSSILSILQCHFIQYVPFLNRPINLQSDFLILMRLFEFFVFYLHR